jgi:hypothetical protein
MILEAPKPLADFVLGFRIATVSGAVVLATNTRLEGYAAGISVRGGARHVLSFPSLDLAPGVYSLDAAVHAKDGAPYDERHDVLRFEVTSDRAGSGVWAPERRWEFSGGIRWNR